MVKSIKNGNNAGLQKSVTSLEEDVKRLGDIKAKIERLESKFNSLEQRVNTLTTWKRDTPNPNKMKDTPGRWEVGAPTRNVATAAKLATSSVTARLKRVADEEGAEEDEASSSKKKE